MPPSKKLDPSALSIDEVAALLSNASGRAILPINIAADVATGAPTNADGSLHLVHYAAWLLREARHAQERTPGRPAR